VHDIPLINSALEFFTVFHFSFNLATFSRDSHMLIMPCPAIRARDMDVGVYR